MVLETGRLTEGPPESGVPPLQAGLHVFILQRLQAGTDLFQDALSVPQPLSLLGGRLRSIEVRPHRSGPRLQTVPSLRKHQITPNGHLLGTLGTMSRRGRAH